MPYTYDTGDPDPSEVKQYWLGSVGPFEIVNSIAYQPETTSPGIDDIPNDPETLRTLRGDQVFLDRDPAVTEEAVRLGGSLGIEATERILGTSIGVDLTATGITVLFSPTATFRFSAIIIHPTSVAGYSAAPSIRVGINGGAADEYVLQTSPGFLNDTSSSWRSPGDNQANDILSGSNVEFEVVTAATATTLNATIYLLGMTMA